MSATQAIGGWWEYRLDAPDLPTLSRALAYIQASGLVGKGLGPDTMLGDRAFEDETNPVNPHWPLFRYGVGVAAGTDGLGNPTPGRGVAGRFYIAIRTAVAFTSLGFDPTSLGLAWSDLDDSAAVMGVWAG